MLNQVQHDADVATVPGGITDAAERRALMIFSNGACPLVNAAERRGIMLVKITDVYYFFFFKNPLYIKYKIKRKPNPTIMYENSLL